jgi:hypothetical protein
LNYTRLGAEGMLVYNSWIVGSQANYGGRPPPGPA